MNQKVYVNRILNMKKIKYIGLDMDHTLIRYNTKNFEALVYQRVIDRLITEKNYPDAIKNLQFHFQDAIRGLVVDSKNGNILKLSRYAAIRQSYHGTKKIDYAEQKQFYRSIYVDLGDPNYIAIDTSFSIAFCVLYSQLIDFKDESPGDLPSYAIIAQDVLSCVDHIHANGNLKQYISAHLDEFVIKNRHVVEGIERFIRHGKLFFILTNSEYYYTKTLLEYAIDPFLTDGKTWQDIFKYTITWANKPRFFYDNLHFLKINPSDGNMIALVVHNVSLAHATEQKIINAMTIKKDIEQEYIRILTKNIEHKNIENEQTLHELQTKISRIDHDISKLLEEQQTFYNPKWERVFRAGAEESYFAHQVDRYACIYMEQLADLLEYSPLTYFRANRRLLAHDVEIT